MMIGQTQSWTSDSPGPVTVLVGPNYPILTTEMKGSLLHMGGRVTVEPLPH